MSDLYLFANVNFVPGKYGEWQAAYDKLGDYVWNHEPTTKTYYFGIPFDYADNFEETTLMFAFEVYSNKEALTETHLKSPTMSNFLSTALPVMSTGLDLANYTKLGGFLTLPSSASSPPTNPLSEDCSLIHDTTITCVSPEARKIVGAKLCELAEKLEKEGGSQVKTFLVCESMDDDLGLRILARFVDKGAMERHIRRKEVLGFWEEVGKTEVKVMGQRGFLPNGKGWLIR